MLSYCGNLVLQVLIVSLDLERGRIAVSTKRQEAQPGDMLHNWQAVFDGAEERAAEGFAAALKSVRAAGECNTATAAGTSNIGHPLQGAC